MKSKILFLVGLMVNVMCLTADAATRELDISATAGTVPTPAPVINPLKMPPFSDSEKFESRAVNTVPFRNEDYIGTMTAHLGLKNGNGGELSICKKLSRYLCGGVRVFMGYLNSHSLTRAPLNTDFGKEPRTSEFNEIIRGDAINWFAIVPEVGLTVNSQIIPLAAGRWSESAWFGFGKAFIGGREGWAFSVEPGVNQRFKSDSALGWTMRVKYTFGWLHPLNTGWGTIPYDWFSINAGLFLVW